jgi:hypothetical protein
MNNLFDAHPLTLIAIMGTMLVTPLYVYALFVRSGASEKTGLVLAVSWLLWGALAAWICLWDIPGALGLPGALIVPAAWILPSALIWIFRKRLLVHPLSMKGIIALQIFRVIGGVFLIEMERGHLPGIFAYPAGWGDILAGLVALFVVVIYWKKPTVSHWAVYLVLAVGMLDFLSAFFFGFTSNRGPLHLFAQDFENQLIAFPTGMIPLFLVPYALFFHILSLAQLHRRAS